MISKFCVTNWLVQLVMLESAIKAGRLSSIPSQLILKTEKMVLVGYPASCSALLGGYKGIVKCAVLPLTHHRYSHHCKNKTAHGASKWEWVLQTTCNNLKSTETRVDVIEPGLIKYTRFS